MNRTNLSSALLALIAVMVTFWLLGQYWPRQADQVTEGQPPPVSTVSIVRLSEAKLAVAGIDSQPVVRQSLLLTRTLPARFAYDDTRHVAVRASTDGVLESVLVKPGDRVAAGQPIAVLRSPQMGAARSEVLSRQADFELAGSNSDWQAAICAGVANLIDAIRKQEPIESIEANFDETTLGTYRSQLLTAYSRALLAAKISQSVRDIGDSGAISGRVVLQRQSQRQQAQAELAAAIEQSLFETRQSCNRAKAATDAARRKVLVARQTLASLLGANQDPDAMLDTTASGDDLARLQIRSPLSGTVERKVHSATERVTADSELFIIADTSRLWVKADIRDRDWDALSVGQGDTVVVTTSVASHGRLPATVYFVGREVDLASGAIPLVAQIDNSRGRYRPGLFARVEVPIGTITDVLVVSDSAVVDLDGVMSVFLAEDAGYRPVAVEVGLQSGDQIEIRSGLREGQSVVVAGAFLLKSELLLEGEE